MATATPTRTAARHEAPTRATTAAPQHTAKEKAVAALVIGAASAVTVGILGWAIWVAGQISIPV
jgi:hypothetical protein